jgi:hypothetical protein
MRAYHDSSIYFENQADAAVLRSFRKPSILRSFKDAFYFLYTALLVNRNRTIEKRINRIRAASPARPWHEMNAQERISYIYRKMAEEKAIERMELLKN